MHIRQACTILGWDNLHGQVPSLLSYLLTLANANHAYDTLTLRTNTTLITNHAYNKVILISNHAYNTSEHIIQQRETLCSSVLSVSMTNVSTTWYLFANSIRCFHLSVYVQSSVLSVWRFCRHWFYQMRSYSSGYSHLSLSSLRGEPCIVNHPHFFGGTGLVATGLNSYVWVMCSRFSKRNT